MHRIMTPILVTLITLAGFCSSAVAANFTSSSTGISIDVDAALKEQPPWRDLQFFTTADNSAGLMIRRIHDLSVVEFLEEMRDVGYRNLRDGVSVGLAGDPLEAKIESGRGLLMKVSGQISGNPVTGVLGAYSGSGGQGFIVIGSTRQGQWSAWEARMKAMFDSISIVDIDRKGMITGWEDRLMGKTLTHEQASVTTNTAGGMVYGGAAHRDYHLCSDGSVVHKQGAVNQMAGQHMAMYGYSMNQSLGNWFVIVSEGAPYLIVRDGEEQKLKLEFENNNFLLDGQPYMITANEQCK